MSESWHSAAGVAELIAQSDDAIMTLATDGSIASWNPAAAAIYGFAAAEAIGLSFDRVVPPDLHEIERRRIARAAAGERTRTAAAPRLRSDGATITVSSMLCPIRDERQSIIAIGAIERDVTREHALEAELLRAKRSEAVGRLARGAAHEVNNINTTILGLVDVVAKHVAHEPAAWADLDEIRKLARRASRLARQLLTFGERRRMYRPVDINETLRATAPLLQHLVSELVPIELELGSGDLLVVADPGQLELVLFELAMRATETLRGSGAVQLATQRVRIDADALPAPAGVPTGDWVRVGLRGIRADADPAPADEWFPSGTAESSALGLGIVSSALLDLHGHLVLGQTPGEATVYLPAAMTPARARAAARGETSSGETILLVEDEPAVRDIVARALRSHGFHVLETRDGEDALAAADEHDAPIHLVISDVIMPNMDGRELFDRLRSWYPNLRFLFVSGYASGAIGTAELRGPATEFLAKPFSTETLYAVVRMLLDRAVR